MKIKLPLTAQRGAHDVIHYRPLIRLEVRTQDGDFAWLEFLVDTGADVTSISVDLAQEKQLHYDTSRQSHSAGVGGHVLHYANAAIRFRVVGKEHNWPCNFILQSPLAPLAQGLPARRLRQLPPLLGRAGFLTDYQVCINDTHMTLRRRGPLSILWYRLRRWWSNR